MASSLTTTLEISGIFIFLIVPALIMKQYWLAGMFFVFGMCFGIGEALSVQFSGLSISQHFWVLRDASYIKALIVAICMQIAWTLLIVHFMVK
jgi:hypothetical protein